MKRKIVSVKKYSKMMDNVIKKGKSVSDTLIEMLEVASNYDLKPERKKK